MIILSACSSQTLGIRKMGDAKVTNLDLATVFCPEQIRGFDVSMDDTLMMDWREPRVYIYKSREKRNNTKLRTIFEPKDSIS